MSDITECIFVKIPKTATQSISLSLGMPIFQFNENRRIAFVEKMKKSNPDSKMIKLLERLINKQKEESNAISVATKLGYHATSLEYLKELGKRKFKSCFSFSFVRNPYDRHVSLYSFLNGTQVKYTDIVDFTEKILDRKVFEKTPTLDNNVFLKQKEFVTDESGNILVKKIYRFENIDEDWESLLRELNLEHRPLVGRNASVHKPWTWYYEKYPKLQDLVLGIYGEDFDTFGYSKEIK